MIRDDDFFWDGVQEEKLRFRRCAHCEHLAYPPVPMCPQCHGLSWNVREASGRGKIVSWVRSVHPARPEDDPRIVVKVELEEGISILSNLQGIDLDDIEEGLPVELFFQRFGDITMHQFRPVGSKS